MARAAAARAVAGPLRPQPRRSLRHLPDGRRHDQVADEGGLDPAVCGQAGVRHRAGRDHGDRADGVRDRAVRTGPAGGRSEYRLAVLPGHVVARRVQRRPRGLVIGQQVRAHRIAACRGTDARI